MSQGLSRSGALYYTEISRTNPVSDPQEERQLIARWQKKKDIVARDTLVQSHLRFVVTLARRRSQDPDRLQDLIAAGNFGLLKALDKYDLNHKPQTRFLTYAGWWIQQEIADEDYATSSLVHVPTHRQKAQRKQARMFQRALQEHGPNAKKVTKMDPGIPEGVMITIDTLRDSPCEAEGSSPMAYDACQSNQLLRTAIGGLPLREQTVLNLYFGVKDEPRNLVQIAAILEMSPERVRQIKISAVKQLRTALEAQAVLSPSDAY